MRCPSIALGVENITNASQPPKLSICIPIFLRFKKDKEFLFELLSSIEDQDTNDFEIVLSLDAKSPISLDINEVPIEFRESCETRLVKCPQSGISLNLNFAISSARGKFIKIMLQDDFFAHDRALSETLNALEKSKKVWLLSASDHVVEESGVTGPVIVPKLKRGLFRGINSVSSPSVVAFRSDYFLRFEESLSLMMDCEWYIRMAHNCGSPYILRSVTVVNRLHAAQTQRGLKHLLPVESQLIRGIHSRKSLKRVRCSCVTQDRR